MFEGGFRGQGEFQLGFHLSYEDIGVILDLCLCCIGGGFLLVGRQALVGLLDPLVAVLVLARVYNLTSLETVAVIDEVQQLKVLEVEIPDVFDLVVLLVFDAELEGVHGCSEPGMP